MNMSISRRHLIAGASGIAAASVMPTWAAAAHAPPPMSPERSLESYRRILCGDIGEEVLWWFIGDLYLHTPGEAVAPIARSLTIGGYRAETATARDFRYRFREAGVIVDLATGEPLRENPFTQQAVEVPLVDEPPEFINWSVQDSGDILKTKHGKQSLLDLRWTETSANLLLIETEPGPNAFGLTPADRGSDWSGIESTRTLYTRRADLAQTGFVPSQMIYNVALKLTLPWMAPATPGDRWFIVRGIGQKSRANEVVNPDALEMIRRFFPNFL